jgi:hypothetical protein
MDTNDNISSEPDLIDMGLWDHYSGLPNPMWYQRIKELEDEKENTGDSIDTTVTTK